MPTDVLILYLLLTLFGVALSALFSGLETGLYTLNRVRLAVEAARGEPRAVRLQRMIRRPTHTLATLLIANNIVNFCGSYGITGILEGFSYGPWQVVAMNALILTPLLFVLGETLPKDLFRTFTDRWTYRLAPLLGIVQVFLTWMLMVPVVVAVARMVNWLLGSREQDQPLPARQRISQLIREGASVGVLSESQTSLVDRALALRNQRVSSVMTPWRSVTTIPMNASADALRRLRGSAEVSHIPIIGQRGLVRGVVRTIDVLVETDKTLESIMHTPMCLAPETVLSEALRQMREGGQGFALVAAKPNQTPLGVVTLRDLVQPLTGRLAAWQPSGVKA